MTKNFSTLLLVGTLAVSATLCSAQEGDTPLPEPASVANAPTGPMLTAGHSFDDLNLLGADFAMPPFSDTISGDGWRRKLLRHGIGFRLNGGPSFSQNLLDPPVPSSKQVYIGQGSYGQFWANPILTMDLKALHLRNAQLNIQGGLFLTDWNPAGPRGADVAALYLFKSLGEDRLEVKAGYLFNNFEFVGFQVGGSLAVSTQGVYANLPFEAGLSHFPLTTPSFNIKWNAPANFYVKLGAQRSTDSAGGPATIARNRFGLRFDPKGDKLVTVYEAGYRRAASNADKQMFLRGGYIHNTTLYQNNVTGGMTSGNYCGFLLADRQLLRIGRDPSHGIYGGASAMIAPASMNAYSQYYEARLYDEAPFRSRPSDTITVIASRSIYSRDTTRILKNEGKSFWRASSSITASYTVHASRGSYISGGLSYVTGPAITPHVPNALVASVGTFFFF